MKKSKTSEVEIVSSKVTLKLKGKSVTLSMEEIRELNQKLNAFSGNYSNYWTSLTPSLYKVVSDTCAVSNTEITATNPITIGEENE